VGQGRGGRRGDVGGCSRGCAGGGEGEVEMPRIDILVPKKKTGYEKEEKKPQREGGTGPWFYRGEAYSGGKSDPTTLKRRVLQ